MVITGYKLVHRRKDGTLGPLYINRKQRITVGEWLNSEYHPTKGYAKRQGWHCTLKPNAPHIKEKDDRVWWEVEVEDFAYFKRPKSQGGLWVLANRMKLIKEVE